MTDEHEHPANAPEQEITSEAPEFAKEQAARTASAAGEVPKGDAASETEPEIEVESAEESGPRTEGQISAKREAPEGQSGERDAPQPKLERLQKILAQAGVASRRHAEELITEGRVQVNGQTVTVLGTKADPERDHIRVDGKLLRGAERLRYFVLNKPKGFVTTVTDPEGRPTVMQFFAKTSERLYPVGRLDYQSEGLLLVTNDGELANQLTRAASRVEKTYLVKVAGQPGEDQLDRLRGGVAIDKGGEGEGKVHTAPARIRQVRRGDNPWYEVILIEGRNRELRKMFEEIGHHVEKIRRVGYGPLVLDVEPGKMRELATEEVEALRLTAAGKLKPRRTKVSLMLPKEAGQSTELRMAKEAARRGKKFQRTYPRDNRRDDFGARRPERSAGPKPAFRPDSKPAPGSRPRPEFRPETGTRPGSSPGTEPRSDSRTTPRPDFRRPPRDDARTSSGRPISDRGRSSGFTAKPAFGGRPPRVEGKFRGVRAPTGAKPRFDRRPPPSESGFRREAPPRGTGRPYSDRPSKDRRPDSGPNHGPNFKPDRAANRTPGRTDDRPENRTDNRAAGRAPVGDFVRPSTSRPRLEIRPVKSDDTAYDKPRAKAFDRDKPRTEGRAGPRSGRSTDGPPRRNDSAPRFGGGRPSRPQGKPFGKGPAGLGKPGFSDRPDKPAFGKPAFGKPGFGKPAGRPAFGSRPQGAGPARSQSAGPSRPASSPPARPQSTGDSPARFKKKDSAPRSNRSGPARGGKRLGGGPKRGPASGSKPRGNRPGGAKRGSGPRPGGKPGFGGKRK